MMTPISTAAIGLANVRFFAAPLPGPHQPWVSFDDLMLAASLDRKRRRFFKSAFDKGIGEHRNVRTPDGPTIIVPHPAAQAFFEVLREQGMLAVDLFDRYTHGATDAMKTITRDMTDGEAIAFMVAAFLNTQGIDPSQMGGRS